VSFSRNRSIASRIWRRCFSEWSIQAKVDMIALCLKGAILPRRVPAVN
jgi:hypothetical protein